MQVRPNAFLVHSVYQGYLLDTLQHEGPLGLDIESKGFHDMRVVKSDCEDGETIKMNWSITETRFNGSWEEVILGKSVKLRLNPLSTPLLVTKPAKMRSSNS